MAYTLSALSEQLNGTFSGASDKNITGCAKIEEAATDQITFIAHKKYISHLDTSGAGAYLVDNQFDTQAFPGKNFIKVANVYAAVSQTLELFNPKEVKTGTSSLAFISETASIAKDCYIGEFTVISDKSTIKENTKIHARVYIGEDVVIGTHCTIYPGVCIMDDTVIGDHCIIHPNTTVGSDGFGFAPLEDGTFQKIPQTGNVVIENHVEIGASCTIDRASMGSTVIKSGVKLDNMIHLAHNVTIDQNTVIAAQTGIAGSTSIGKNCMIGGQVGIVGHLNIADRTLIQAKSGLSKSIRKEGSKLYGYPAIDYTNYLKSYAIFKNLEDLQARVKMLESKLNET